MNTSLRLGKIFGIPLGVNYSWFIIFGLVTVALAAFYFPVRSPGYPEATYWLIGLAASLLFFGSVVAHELAHCAVSIATGVPVRGITLFIFGGVAQLERDASQPKNELVMALAGPVSSFVMGALFGVLYLLSRQSVELLAALSWWLALINISLGAFNLFPGFPLDGGRALRAIIWWITGNMLKATRIAATAGRVGGYLFIFGGLLAIFRGMVFDGLWIAFIGWYLDNAAQASLRQTVMRHSLNGLTARDLMNADLPVVHPSTSVAQFVGEYILKSPQRTFLVATDGELAGIVSPQSLRKVPRDRWEWMSVREIMVPLADLKKASVSEEAVAILDRMEEFNLAQLPVEQEGRIVGLVRRDSLIQFIQTRAELGV